MHFRTHAHPCPGVPVALMPQALRVACLMLAGAGLTACGDSALLMANEDTGASPRIVAPNESLIPTLKIAPAVGWPDDALPVAADGWTVTAFARDLSHPRWVYVLPNGDVLVAESNAPPGKSGISGLKGAIMGSVMKKAGSGTPSADRITRYAMPIAMAWPNSAAYCWTACIRRSGWRSSMACSTSPTPMH